MRSKLLWNKISQKDRRHYLEDAGYNKEDRWRLAKLRWEDLTGPDRAVIATTFAEWSESK